jgi:hypothetical protein
MNKSFYLITKVCNLDASQLITVLKGIALACSGFQLSEVLGRGTALPCPYCILRLPNTAIVPKRALSYHVRLINKLTSRNPDVGSRSST